MLRFASMLFVASLLVARPACAAESAATLPAVKSFSAARFEVAPMVVNGQPVVVGRGEIASPSRAHLVLKTLPDGGQPEQTLEIVLYDGTTYVRQHNSSQWYIEQDRDVCCVPPADASLDDAVAAFGTPDAVT